MFDLKYKDGRKVFNEHDGIPPYISFKMLDELGIPNLYTTRYEEWAKTAGTGTKGLRVALMNGEDVAEARQVISGNLGRLAERLGATIDDVCVTNQKHTTNVIALGKEDTGYRRSIAREDPIDGVITDVPGACLVVYGADCPSIYLADPENGAIGLVHAGWRGTLGRIPEVAVRMMKEKYGSDPARMYAAVGPSICLDCYEMGNEVYDVFREQWGVQAADRLLKKYPAKDREGNEIPGGKYHLDLWTANRMTLESCGIPAGHIELTNLCTCCNCEELYSYRAGRMENEQAAMMVCRFGR